MSRLKTISVILRASLALSFIYAAISAFLHPSDWVTFFPNILRNNVKDTFLLDWWGLFEIILATWLISGKRIFIPSIITVVTIASIIVINLNIPDTIFQDIPTLAVAVVLSIIHFPNRRTINTTPIR